MKTKQVPEYFKLRFFFFLILFMPLSFYGQDFVYKPINPAFGGNYLNYSWLLNSAEAQNTFSDPNSTSPSFDKDNLTNFEESLQRQVLNQIARGLTQDKLGTDGLKDGYYEIGNFQIDVTSDYEGLVINITDINTGAETTISVPYF